MILEPVLMNCGIVPPEPGFLECLRHDPGARGVFWTFDEVKTGLTVGRGGATVKFGVVPTSFVWRVARRGLAVAAIGGTEE